MGRVKSKAVKRDAMMIYESEPDSFTESFDENKQKVEEHAEISSKKLRNVIAGYITRIVRKSGGEEQNG